MRNLRRVLLLVCLVGLPATVAASEVPDAVVDAVKHLFDNKAPDKIGPSPMPGFFQVTFGAQLYYVSKDGRYLVAGAIYEVASKRNLTEEGQNDALLGGLKPGARTLEFNAVHGDIVSRLPPGAVRLATNAVALNQAYKFRDHVWAVQFHPEFSEEVMKLYVEGRAQNVSDDAVRRGASPSDALNEARASVKSTPMGPKLIRTFVERFVLEKNS